MTVLRAPPDKRTKDIPSMDILLAGMSISIRLADLEHGCCDASMLFEACPASANEAAQAGGFCLCKMRKKLQKPVEADVPNSEPAGRIERFGDSVL